MKKKLCLFLAFLIFAACFVGCSESKEKEKRDTSEFAMFTENFEITKGMLQYHFNTIYLSFVNSNSEYLESLGLDTAAPLSEQNYSSTTSWYDYFMDAAKRDLSNYLVIAEKAKKDSVNLSKAEKNELETDFSILEDYAKEKDMELNAYLKETYGESVTVKDVKAVLELQKLGTRYFKTYTDSLKITDEEMEKYYSDRKKTYSKIDYLLFETVFSPEDSSEKIMAGSAANRFAEKKSEKEFIEYISEYINDYYTQKDESDFDQSKVNKIIKEAQKNCKFENVSYNSSDPGLVWAFSEDRASGDTKIIEDSENGKYYIYYILTPMYREEYAAVNIRQIFFSLDDYITFDDALSSAEASLERLEAANFSESAFKSEAKNYSSDDATKNNGGLQEKLYLDSFEEYAIDIRNWIFDESRAEGDAKIIKNEAGWYIVYIDAFLDAAWKTRVKDGILNSKFNSYISELSDEYVITINSDVVYSIAPADV